MIKKPIVVIYTDGSYNAKTNCGGWGASVYYNEEVVHYSDGAYDTTNNRMELMAAIASMDTLTCSCVVHLYADSKYVLDGLGWVSGWKKNDWMTSSGSPVKNKDLWEKLHAHMEQHQIKTHWVKGHSGDVYNEIVDRLADDARSSLEHSMILDKRYGGS